MNGIFVVDKPAGFTSFDVVAKMRGICKTKKIGHGGTLDPMATGVLPVFVGRAVKAVDLQPAQDKEYEAEILFGLATDTGDVTGQTLASQEVDVTAGMLKEALPRFLGPQQQLPPMYSAVKVGGRPLYAYAREGKEVERKPRQITVHSIEYLGQAGQNRHRVGVACSKGTYIRTLAEEIGKALGAPATLAALRRTRAGVFGIGQALPLEALQTARDAGALEEALLPCEVVFAGYPALALEAGARKKLLDGAFLPLNAAPGLYRGRDGEGFIGLVRVEAGVLRAEKILCDR